MLKQTQCSQCEGSGKCSDCDGTGTNPHLNSAAPKCPRCSGTGSCPECAGSGKSSIARPVYQGSLLKHGLFWAAILVGFWGLVATINNHVFTVLAMLGWFVFLYVVFYRNAQKAKSDR